MRRCCLIMMGGLAVAAAGCGGDGGNGPPTITSVVVSGDSTVVLAGTRQLTATAMAGSTPLSTGVTFQWSSSDTTHATVSASGVVSGVRLGSSNISALAVLNGTPTSVSSSRPIRTRIGSIVITPGTPTFASLGDSVQASAEARNALNAAVPGIAFTWLSRTPGVATVTARGNNTLADAVAIANGTARIVVTGDGVSDSVTATVDQVAASISLLPANLGTPDVEMTINQSAPFYAVVRDSTGNIDPRARTDVTWSVAPGTSASVSASTSGTATVTTNGTASSETIQATIGAISGQRVVAVVATGVSFATGVQSVFTSNCSGCHGGASPSAGLSLAAGVAHGATVDQPSGQSSLRRVRPLRPDSSYLVHKIQGTQASVGGTGSRMPLGQAPLTNAVINTIRNWMLQGALNN